MRQRPGRAEPLSPARIAVTLSRARSGGSPGAGDIADTRASTRALRSRSAASSGTISSSALTPWSGRPEWDARPVPITARSSEPKQPPQFRVPAPPFQVQQHVGQRPRLGEVADAGIAPALLVGAEGQNGAKAQRSAGLLQVAQRVEHGGYAALHVRGAAAEEAVALARQFQWRGGSSRRPRSRCRHGSRSSPQGRRPGRGRGAAAGSCAPRKRRRRARGPPARRPARTGHPGARPSVRPDRRSRHNPPPAGSRCRRPRGRLDRPPGHPDRHGRSRSSSCPQSASSRPPMQAACRSIAPHAGRVFQVTSISTPAPSKRFITGQRCSTLRRKRSRRFAVSSVAMSITISTLVK